MSCKFLFDGQATQGSSRSLFHGGGEYAKFVLREAIARGYRFDIVFSSRLITDPAIEKLLEQNPQYRVFYVANKQELYQLIEEQGYEKFYSALPYRYCDYRGRAGLLGVIHGLRAIELPWDEYRYLYYTNGYKKLAALLISRLSFLQRRLKKRHWP